MCLTILAFGSKMRAIVARSRKGSKMKRLLFSLVLCVLIAAPLSAEVSIWGLMNPDSVTARLGLTGGQFEAGISAGYMSDLRPDTVEAYRAGTYALWIVNPDAQFPIRGWMPGNPEWLPETIPVQFYIGGLLDFEFKDHKLMPALVGGAQVKTGTWGSIGVEAGRTFNAATWDKLAEASDGWFAMLGMRILVGKPAVSVN